jgi:hypothetical protein
MKARQFLPHRLRDLPVKLKRVGGNDRQPYERHYIFLWHAVRLPGREA